MEWKIYLQTNKKLTAWKWGKANSHRNPWAKLKSLKESWHRFDDDSDISNEQIRIIYNEIEKEKEDAMFGKKKT